MNSCPLSCGKRFEDPWVLCASTTGEIHWIVAVGKVQCRRWGNPLDIFAVNHWVPKPHKIPRSLAKQKFRWQKPWQKPKILTRPMARGKCFAARSSNVSYHKWVWPRNNYPAFVWSLDQSALHRNIYRCNECLRAVRLCKETILLLIKADIMRAALVARWKYTFGGHKLRRMRLVTKLLTIFIHVKFRSRYKACAFVYFKCLNARRTNQREMITKNAKNNCFCLSHQK